MTSYTRQLTTVGTIVQQSGYLIFSFFNISIHLMYIYVKSFIIIVGTYAKVVTTNSYFKIKLLKLT